MARACGWLDRRERVAWLCWLDRRERRSSQGSLSQGSLTRSSQESLTVLTRGWGTYACTHDAVDAMGARVQRPWVHGYGGA